MGGAFRRMHGEIEDTQFGRNVAALKAELDEEEAERDQVTGEAKTKIQAKTDVTRAKLQAIQNGIQARIDSSKQEMEAKIKSLREQAVKACSQWKAKLKARSAEVRAEHDVCHSKLVQTQTLIHEALPLNEVS